MVLERRRSNLHDLMNQTQNESSSKKRRRSSNEHEQMFTSQKFRPMLPPIDTPDKCQSILGCHDNHPKDTHDWGSRQDQYEYHSRGPNAGMTGQQKVDASQYPSPNSASPANVHKMEFRTSASALSGSVVGLSSCNSSNPSGSFSQYFHTCLAGPNALDRRTSASQASQPSISRHSSDQRDRQLPSSQGGHAVSPLPKNGWKEESDCVGTGLDSDETREQSRKETLAAFTLFGMCDRRRGDPQPHSAGDGDENHSPTDLCNTGEHSQYIYRSDILPPVQPATEQEFHHSISDQRRSPQTKQLCFTDPFSSQAGQAALNLQMAFPERKLPPLVNESAAPERTYSNGASAGTKRRRSDEDVEKDEAQRYGRVTSGHLIAYYSMTADSPGYAPIQADSRPRLSYGRIQHGPEQAPSGSTSADIRCAGSESNATGANDSGRVGSSAAPTSAEAQYAEMYRNPAEQKDVVHARQSASSISAESRHAESRHSGTSDNATEGRAIAQAHSSAAAPASSSSDATILNSIEESQHEARTAPSSASAATRSFVCAFESGCDTAGDNPRKAFSDFFGRNKSCTMQVPAEAWIVHCRQHYQRLKYRYQKENAYYALKTVGISKQIEKFDRYMGAKAYPEHGPIVWTIGFQKGLRQAVNEAVNRVYNCQETLLQSEDEKIRTLMEEVTVAMALEDLTGDDKTSEDCQDFLKRLRVKCAEAGLPDLIRVEFLPVKWGGRERMKPVAQH